MAKVFYEVFGTFGVPNGTMFENFKTSVEKSKLKSLVSDECSFWKLVFVMYGNEPESLFWGMNESAGEEIRKELFKRKIDIEEEVLIEMYAKCKAPELLFMMPFIIYAKYRMSIPVREIARIFNIKKNQVERI